MSKKKIYLASGWFCPLHLDQVQNLEQIIEECGYEVFSPRKETCCLPNATQKQRKETLNKNLVSILDCDIILVNTSNGDKGKIDTGTIFEAGYAYANNKPIIYFCENLKNTSQFNLMLAESAIAICVTYQELYDALLEKEYKKWKGEIE